MSDHTLLAVYGALPVTPGVLDANAEVALRSGGCTQFALAIHAATGLGIVAAFEGGLWSDAVTAVGLIGTRTYIGFVHALIALPDGRLLDSSGPQSADEYRHVHPLAAPHDLFPVTPAETERLGLLCLPSDPVLVATFVEPLLRAHGLVHLLL